MKTVSSLKSTKTESPKTPGGISKSLLTPCRRLGLSRNWKKVGPSPFVSPLSNSNSVEVKEEKKETRKRKVRVPDEENVDQNEETPTPVEDVKSIIKSDIDISGTPSRHVELPRKKKSKTLLSVLSLIDNSANVQDTPQDKQSTEDSRPDVSQSTSDSITRTLAETVAVSTPVRVKSKSDSVKKTSPPKDGTVTEKPFKPNSKDEVTKTEEAASEETIYQVKPRSPNDLTKECIVVIQKKVFKIDKKKNDESNIIDKNTKSQALFDSDSDEVPLSTLNKKVNAEVPKTDIKIINLEEDDDFMNKDKKVKVKKLEDKNTSTSGLKTKNKKKDVKPQKIPIIPLKPSSQSSNSFDDDEDFDFDDKKTILIRKTYDKVAKPQKAKSTGSITQRDIDDLRARIETKKKMLLAKAMTEDTAELRGLIKKWQKGCQDALMELMELMKTKFPDKQNMPYSEMLQSLKIPATLVGYDSDNDCFNTPDDESIILSKFNDL